jgi:hypothetical protein
VPIHLVQITDGAARRVALVEEPNLRCLACVWSVYELAQKCLERSHPMARQARVLAPGEVLSCDEIYAGRSSWRRHSPIDAPNEPSRTLVAGTGLTHLGSARQRQSMHLADEQAESPRAEVLTDSMRMFKWGVEQGRPPEGAIGVAPEWVYKGDGFSVRAHLEPLDIPSHTEDGGEVAELAGVYIVAADGSPWRIGIAHGKEFSDHKFEKRNHLNLAGSKLRTSGLGPELVPDPPFADVSGEVGIERAGAIFWNKQIASGEQKYVPHPCQP